MRKILSLLILFASIMPAMAQNLGEEINSTGTQDVACTMKIGYLSYEEALASIPELETVRQDLDTLRAQYDAEIDAAEKEFNKKYEAFLDNVNILARPIRDKRQSELQVLLETNAKFRKESERLLRQAEADAMVSLRNRVSAAISRIAIEKGLKLVVNTDSDACPFIDPASSVNITDDVIELLKK